jgi:hypothetical protein
VDREHLASGGEHVESITNFSLDSLNQLYFKEFRSQLTKRFPNMNVIDASHQNLPSDTNFQLRVTRLQVADNIWLVGPSGAPKVYCILEIEMFDARAESSLFTLQAKAKIMELVYANPWQKAAQYMVVKIVDYIDSNGEDYEKP